MENPLKIAKRKLRVRVRQYLRDRKPILFNEAVDIDRKAIFVAVPKTGTTGIREQMRNRNVRYMVPWPHLNIRQIRDGMKVHAWTEALDINRQFPTDPGHVGSQDELIARTEAFYDECFKFSTVRNPWARVASMYSRREGIPMSKDMDFDAFCLALRYASDTCQKPTRHQNQIDWVTDETGEIAVDLVMRLEEISEGLEQIREMTEGRLILRHARANVNTGSISRNYRDRYSAEARDHVAKIFARDIEAFDYSF